MAKFVGAIDQGTSSTRFIVFDHGGTPTATAHNTPCNADMPLTLAGGTGMPPLPAAGQRTGNAHVTRHVAMLQVALSAWPRRSSNRTPQWRVSVSTMRSARPGIPAGTARPRAWSHAATEHALRATAEDTPPHCVCAGGDLEDSAVDSQGRAQRLQPQEYAEA